MKKMCVENVDPFFGFFSWNPHARGVEVARLVMRRTKTLCVPLQHDDNDDNDDNNDENDDNNNEARR